VSRHALRLRTGRPGTGSGQALVEFALVIPIFLLILFAILQLGLLFGGQNSLVNAVREAARYAAPYRVVSGGDATSTCPMVGDKLEDALRANPLTSDTVTRKTDVIEYTWELDPNGEYFVQVRVEAHYKFPLYVPLVNQFLDGMDGVQDSNLELSAQEEMRIENEPLGNTDTAPPCS
jgi:hypothetical protein